MTADCIPIRTKVTYHWGWPFVAKELGLPMDAGRILKD